MKPILVPVELSDNNEKIFEKAIEIAKLIDGKVYILHVANLDIGFIIGEVGFQYLPELEKTELEEEAKELQKIEAKVSANVPCEIILKQGIPSEVILEQIKDLNAYMVIIGSHGRSSIYEAILGSVSHDVLKHSPVPVLVMPASH